MYFSQHFCSLCLKKDPPLHEMNKTMDCLSCYFKLSVVVPEMRCNEIKNGFICGICRTKVNDMYQFRNMCLRNKSVNSRYVSNLQRPATIVDNAPAIFKGGNHAEEAAEGAVAFVSVDDVFHDQIKCEPLDIKVEEDFEYVDVTMDPLRESTVESSEPHNYTVDCIEKPQKCKRSYGRKNTKMPLSKRQKVLEQRNDAPVTIVPLSSNKPDGPPGDIDIENFLAMHMVPQSDPLDVVFQKSYVSKFKIRNVKSLSQENEQETPSKRVPGVTDPTDEHATYKCHTCNWKGYSLSSYEKHVSKQHSLAYNNFIHEARRSEHKEHQPHKWKTAPYQPMNQFTDRVTCQICNMTLPNPTVLITHNELMHIPSVKCSVCSKSFHTVQAMMNHSKLNHDKTVSTIM